MAKELVPFWEEAYQNKDIIAFLSKPNVTIKEFEELFRKHSRVLDVGCGEGQNAIYLAHRVIVLMRLIYQNMELQKLIIDVKR